jgi:hypothetical protein
MTGVSSYPITAIERWLRVPPKITVTDENDTKLTSTLQNGLFSVLLNSSQENREKSSPETYLPSPRDASSVRSRFCAVHTFMLKRKLTAVDQRAGAQSDLLWCWDFANLA